MFTRKWPLVVVIFLAVPTSFGQEVLFRDGRTDWKIYLSPQAAPTEVFAAQELHDVLKKISGVDFEVVSSGKASESRAIIVGNLENPEVRARAAALKLSAGEVEEVAVYTLGGRLYLAGNQARGALYAVYCFLQRELGVRWLWPGLGGEFVPAKRSWALPEIKFNHKPAFRYRGFHLCGDWRDVEIFREWMARNFINIHRHAASVQEKRRGFYSAWSSHNVTLPAAVFGTHPEYFSEIDGRRYPSNICFSHPEVDKIIAGNMADYLCKHPYVDILSVFPSDNQDYCRCARCAKTDVSTAWFEFYNRLTDRLKKEFPSLKLATIAYQGYRDVPKCRIRNSEFVEYASYSRCNIHPYGKPGCKHNEETMQAMLAWQATGLPIGNYAYEYDIFTRNGRFAPFLSVIDDAIKTGKRLGHVAMITEVGLSPKLGPEVEVNNVQNRLSLYLYARLLWEPDRKMTDVLGDWCQTAFGGAAGPMYDYYTGMDREWSEMPVHATILGDALGIAPALMADKLPEKAAACLAAAEQRLASITDAGTRHRAADALDRERVMFNQWMELSRLCAGVPRLSLPLVAGAAAFARTASRPEKLRAAGGESTGLPADVRLAWTREALLVKWACQARGQPGDGDSVELQLSSGLGGPTWHFTVDPRGTQRALRDSAVGVREDRWNPAWQSKTRVATDFWEAEMVIPFASLGRSPNPNESWQGRFLRHGGAGPGSAAAVFPDREVALLFFSSVGRTDRSLLWWSGAPDREGRRDSALIQDFAQIGWQVQLVTSGEKLAAQGNPCDAYWFRHPHGPNKVPADYWQKHLGPAVKNGALAVFASYWDIPLDRYFQDPSMKVKVVSCGKIPLAARRSTFIAPGDWSSKPNDLLGRLKTGITPAYGLVPAAPAAWTVLAAGPSGRGESFPYLLARPYGKGMVIVCGDSIPLSAAKMLENFVMYRESSKQRHP